MLGAQVGLIQEKACHDLRQTRMYVGSVALSQRSTYGTAATGDRWLVRR